MITVTGREVWPERGCPSMYDIGYGLSRQARFAGQTKEFYSVLSHSYVVAELVPPEARIYALLHDAAECIRGDIPSPWKTDADRRVEELIMRRVYREAGVLVPTKAIKKAVKHADMQALMAEAHIIGAFEPEDRWPVIDISDEALRATMSQLHTRTHQWFKYPDVAGQWFSNEIEDSRVACGRLREKIHS